MGCNCRIEMADAIAFYDFAYLNRKIRYAAEWKPTKDHLNEITSRATIQDIDSALMIKLSEDHRKELFKKHYSERLRILYDATENLITALQVRIKVMESERRESKYATNQP